MEILTLKENKPDFYEKWRKKGRRKEEREGGEDVANSKDCSVRAFDAGRPKKGGKKGKKEREPSKWSLLVGLRRRRWWRGKKEEKKKHRGKKEETFQLEENGS